MKPGRNSSQMTFLDTSAIYALADSGDPNHDTAVERLQVDQSLHASGIRALQKSGKCQISLVDHVSFLVMRRRAVAVAFAFDPDFAAAGFQLLEPS